MFLDIVEALFLKEADRRLVVGGCIDDHHPHPLFLHAVLDLLEQPASHATLLNIPADPQPDQIAVFPGRVVFCDRCSQGKPENLLPRFRHQAEFAVRIEEGGDLVFVPGTVETLERLGGKDLLADMKDLGKIVDGHLPDAEMCLCLLMTVSDMRSPRWIEG